MRIDDYDFEQTARAVFIMNDSSRDRYDTWEDLRDFMVSMAYTYGRTTTSFGTGGFQLSFFNSSDGQDICCRASVSAFVALKYAESINDRLNHIASLAKA
jgi:hypothetical protein